MLADTSQGFSVSSQQIRMMWGTDSYGRSQLLPGQSSRMASAIDWRMMGDWWVQRSSIGASSV